MNDIEEDDDTDGDGLPNFFDSDDDGDGRPTSEEIIERTYVFLDGEAEPVWPATETEVKRIYDAVTMETTIYTLEYTDEDNDGTPDYLDADS
jgi:FKBP-type peptidyl-prolyl cis-trans isomerase FkpA